MFSFFGKKRQQPAPQPAKKGVCRSGRCGARNQLRAEAAAIASRDEAMRETLAHKTRVADLLQWCIAALLSRAIHHDDSKFSPQEWPYFSKATARLRGLTYGSEAYKQGLDEIRPGVEIHQKSNRHHPECHQSGIAGMTLIDLVEMLADWKAATERHDDGSLSKSLEYNRTRFGIEPQLAQILENTAREMGWLPEQAKP